MPAFPVAQLKSNATIVLKNDVRYTIDKPLSVGAGLKPGQVIKNLKITTTDPKGKPFILEFKPKDKTWDAIIFNPNTFDCLLENICIDAKTGTRGVNVQGTRLRINKLSTTDQCHCAVFLNGATDTIIENCTQHTVVPVGFFYSTGANGVILRNIETWGDYFENEFRTHASKNMQFINVRAYAANPQNNVDFNHDGNLTEGEKDNAFRIHDVDGCVMDGCIGTGNFRFGCMGDYNGGLEMWDNSNNVNKYPKQSDRDRFRSEWKRQMEARNQKFIVKNSKFYGWIRLEAGMLNGVFDNVEIYAPGGGNIVRVDPDYKAGPMTRPAPTALWHGLRAYSLAIPGAEKAAMKGPYDIVALCEKYAKLGKFNTGVNLFSTNKGMTTQDVQVNVKKV